MKEMKRSHRSMEGQNIRIVTIGILATVYLLFGCPEFLHQDNAYIALLHNFFHANIFHLAVNSLSIWVLFRKGVRYGIGTVILAFLIATGSWFFAAKDVVGISNFIFAIIGLRTPPLNCRWWLLPNTITFFVVTALMAFLPNVSAITHIVSFLLGCMAAAATRIINKAGSDYNRAAYHR